MIRELEYRDKASLNDMLLRTPNFNDEDVSVAMELIEITIENSEQEDYKIFVSEENEGILGYYCIGRRPITDAVYDLYWIVTDPSFIRRGIGRRLLEHAEEFVIKNNGRWLLAETSSKDGYELTRSFYEKNGYSIISKIDHFYRLNESLVVFGKYFWNNK